MAKTPELVEYEKLWKRLFGRFHKACADYRLLEDGDYVMIGLSGGKDSLALVEMLGAQQRIYKPRIRVCAVHVSVSNIGYQSDRQYLSDFCQKHGVEYIPVETSFEDRTSPAPVGEGVPEGRERGFCFLCSWYRRKALFDLAQERGCNKIALGHHMDDIVETALMNMVFHGSISTITPSLKLDKMPITMIRPLCLLQESELKRFAELRGYVKQQKLCPYEHDSHRADAKRLVSQLEQLNPNVRESIWHALHTVREQYLPKL